MKRFALIFAAGAALFVSGCGGNGGTSTTGLGNISGVASDLAGNPVRNGNVTVHANGRTFKTKTSTNGTYNVVNVFAGDVLVQVDATENNIQYHGQNFVTVNAGENSKNVNITVGVLTTLASIHGVVKDSSGNLLAGIKVFAFAQGGAGVGNALSSSFGITGSDGSFSINGLIPNVTYTVLSNARLYDSDSVQVTLANSENRQVDLQVPPSSHTTLSAPANLTAISWTSPLFSTQITKANYAAATRRVMQLFDESHGRRNKIIHRANGKLRQHSQQSLTSSDVEVDLSFDSVNSGSLLGYGIYRGVSSANFMSLDVLRDPLANYYADLDSNLNVGVTYSYEVTSLNTDFPGPSGSESAPSNIASAIPLGQMNAGSVGGNPLQFTWTALDKADSYVVYVFDRIPTVDVVPIWDNASSPATGTRLNYGGPGLVSGQTYYYYIIALANNQTSRSVSSINQFTF